MIQPRSVAAAMNRSIASHGSARSLSGLAAMMAHEIKNPLSGISGAAQLLEMKLGDSESELLRLIHDEVDRIRILLDRMDFFGDSGPTPRRPVNIHDVLNQARSAAAAGFARDLRIKEIYDPSLPPVPGDRVQLLQAVSNLLKNAAEAAPRRGGEVTLRTAFRPGVKIATAGGARESLPLEVSIIDNGPGVPETLRPHIFEPFVTSKTSGSGPWACDGGQDHRRSWRGGGVRASERAHRVPDAAAGLARGRRARRARGRRRTSRRRRSGEA